MNVKELIHSMTLEEKAGLCSGLDFWHTKPVDRLGIPSVMVSDGPHGLRKQDMPKEEDHPGLNEAVQAVCFPAACAAACTFDRKLMYDMGVTLGKECQAEGISVLLGPAVNMKRSPLCGRNFEYLSEDPYLAGELAASYINGVQSQNIGTSIKHFAANNQEHERMYGSSEVDERTLREIYFPAFETAVKKAQPWTVMCSYNKINGEYSSQNRWLLRDILKDEWGFKGCVVSDWGAVCDRVKGIIAGLDLEMPCSNETNDKKIVEAVQAGTLDESILDEAVERILTVIFRYTEHKQDEVFNRKADHKKAVEMARRTTVLLKNEGILPLSGTEKAAFIGGFAEKPRYQGGGSSHVNTVNVPSAVSLTAGNPNITYAKGFSADDDVTDAALMKEAMQTASRADVILVFAGLPDSFESECYDRTHMSLPRCQLMMIEKLLTLQKPVIIILHNGSPVEMPWINDVDAVVEAYLGGEGIAEALLDILYGRVNPCGRLAETFPLKLEHNPSYLNFPGTDFKVNYAEGIFIGYRYYDTKQIDVLFPFGHGLSYTNFAYSNFTVSAGQLDIRDTLTVSMDVTNTGSMAGKDVVQVYISDKTGTAIRPRKELKQFEAVELLPGETRRISFELDHRSFACYDETLSEWYAPNGAYDIMIGKSAADIVLKTEIMLTGSKEKKLLIDENVMIGKLMECKQTKAYVQSDLWHYIIQFIGEKPEGDFDLMVKNNVKYLPLRTLRNFSDMTNDDVDRIVADLKKLMEQ